MHIIFLGKQVFNIQITGTSKIFMSDNCGVPIYPDDFVDVIENYRRCGSFFVNVTILSQEEPVITTLVKSFTLTQM